MTLPESLARKALPCRCYVGQDGWPSGHSLSCAANHRPDVEAAIRKAIRECAVIADMDADACCYSCKQIGREIEMLLTHETP